MAEATKPRKSPNGKTAVRSGPVAARVAKLRERARTDATGAREDGWAWIQELSTRSHRDHEGALAELQELFVCGSPATAVSGQTEGTLVTWTLGSFPDWLLGSITGAWMPWVGKKFDPAKERGINTLTGGARWPSKLIWPLYGTKPAPLGREAFVFNTYVEPGRLDPGTEVLVIDYESVPENPDLLIRQIRDELVEIVPGANLGKMLVSVPGRSEPVLALYFALKSEL
jgi:hypothetical protein